MTWILIVLFLILVWHVIGWGLVISEGLVTSKKGKIVVDKIYDFTNWAENISPYLGLLIVFGPLGLMYKKHLYDRNPEE